MKYAFLLLILVVGCQLPKVANSYDNPPAKGFNLEASHLEAIALVDSVVYAHGGRKAWDETEFVKWNFFGSRRHVWNKHTGDVVIEGIRDTFLIKMNINEMSGSVNYRGEEMTHKDSLDKYLQLGKEMWINDGYWLFLPFKLKDSGVTLKKLAGFPIVHDSLGRLEQLELTFDDVGVTPQNKYVVTIEGNSHRIHQWEFYRNYQDTVPVFSTPWTNYDTYGEIVLSSSRGENYDITEIAVGDSLAKYFD